MDNLFKEYEGVFSPTPEGVGGPTKSVGPEKFFAYSPFALQDALGEKNVKKIWIEYNKLILADIEPEDIIHKIVSKVRDMSAINRGATAIDLGVKDYTYSKSKQHIKNWKGEELKNLYTKLVSIYHRSRMGDEALEIALEKTLLSL